MDAMALLCNLHADGPSTMRRLRQAGCHTLEDLHNTPAAKLASILEVPESVARRFIMEARFLAERAQEPGFTYEVIQDPVRGWIVAWKEFTNRGTVRGYGQFCERPYAWLDD